MIEGSAIQLHPLVTTAFNADFDGDQMAVHVPLSDKAVWEARNLMLSSKNLLKPADGEPIISPSKDMVLGVYYLTMKNDLPHKGDGHIFSTMDEAELVYSLDQIDVHANVKYHALKPGMMTREIVSPFLLNVLSGYYSGKNYSLIAFFREQIQFVNEVLDKGGVKDLIAHAYEICGEDITTNVAD